MPVKVKNHYVQAGPQLPPSGVRVVLPPLEPERESPRPPEAGEIITIGGRSYTVIRSVRVDGEVRYTAVSVK